MHQASGLHIAFLQNGFEPTFGMITMMLHDAIAQQKIEFQMKSRGLTQFRHGFDQTCRHLDSNQLRTNACRKRESSFMQNGFALRMHT